MIFGVPWELRKPPGPILEASETHPGWFHKDFSVISAEVCQELTRKSPSVAGAPSPGFFWAAAISRSSLNINNNNNSNDDIHEDHNNANKSAVASHS